jgi:hypothetical protein
LLDHEVRHCPEPLLTRSGRGFAVWWGSCLGTPFRATLEEGVEVARQQHAPGGAVPPGNEPTRLLGRAARRPDAEFVQLQRRCTVRTRQAPVADPVLDVWHAAVCLG